MRRTDRLFLPGLLLALASPAAAQGPDPAEGDYRGGDSSSAWDADESDFGTDADLVPVDARSFDGTPRGRGRDRIVGSLTLAGNADVKVGLISVVHAAPKELARRRIDIGREVRPPESRVAAVGFSLRF